MLHKMLRRHLESLIHALADGDARHDDDKLAPAVTPVQLKNRLYVNVGLARPRLHLHIERAASEGRDKSVRQPYVPLGLQCTDIVEKLFVRQKYLLVPEPCGVQLLLEIKLIRVVLRCPSSASPVSVLRRPQVAHILRAGAPRLSLKNADDSLHRVRLVLLNLKIKLHSPASSSSRRNLSKSLSYRRS